MNFSDFVQYMIDHENRLELVFKDIDVDTDSIFFVVVEICNDFFHNKLKIKDKIGHSELIGYFKKLGVEISQNEAKKLVEK